MWYDIRMTGRESILIGNSFPLSLVRKSGVRLTCTGVEELRRAANGRRIVSFWGHENTRKAAEHITGFSLATKSARPAVSLSHDKLPMLDGEEFTECWVLSPDYANAARPSIGQEVAPESIIGWQVLKIAWL